MPWQESSPMDLRVRFIADWQSNAWSMTELCADYHVSRKTGYKWVTRYEASGARGLHDQSRRPHTHPQAIAQPIVEELLALRRRHPRWGAKKLLAVAARRAPTVAWPSRAALCDWLKAAGLTHSGRRRPARPRVAGSRLMVPDRANAVWTTDFKGEFRTRDGRYCYPLTVRDGFSRFVLRCDAFLAPTYELTRRGFQRAFLEYGLPDRIRSDNGGPFARPGLGGLSRLSVWWMRLGIVPERIAPGHPEQNGSHEQFHAVLKAATTRPPAAHCAAQHRRFARFRVEYNHERPHEALDNDTPANHYDRSARPMPARLPGVEYAAHLEVRRVATNGCIRWRSHSVFVTSALAGEDIAFEEIAEALWTVRFGPVALARFDERQRMILPVAAVTEGRSAASPPRA